MNEIYHSAPAACDSVPHLSFVDLSRNRKEQQENSQPEVKSKKLFFVFFRNAFIWQSVILIIAKIFAASHLWFIVSSIFFLSLPISLWGIYSGTIRQIRRLAHLKETSWIYKIVSARFCKVAFWIFWALASSFFMIIQFHTYSFIEWLIFFLVIPVFYFVFIISRRAAASALTHYQITWQALTWAQRLCPFIMLAIYMVLFVNFGEPPAYESLQDAISAQKAAVSGMTGSALVHEISQYLAIYDGFKDYALGRLGHKDTFWALILLSIGGLVVFYNACAMLSCFLIPGVEYRRIFGQLSRADKPQPLPLSRIAVIAAIFTFVTLFVYIPLFSYLERWVQQSPQMAMARQSAESLIIPKIEQIGDAFFKEGTISKLQEARLEALQEVEVSLVRLESEVDRAFDKLEYNVDGYLDWYYSLVGEYSRIATLLVGELENYMEDKLEEHLQQGDVFRGVQNALTTAMAVHKEAQEVFQRHAQKIMDENSINPSGSKFHIVQKVSLKDVLNQTLHHDQISFHNRLIAGSGASLIVGAATMVMTKKIIGKLVSKNVIKLAAKALAKVVVSKTVGTAGGVGAGAAAGAAIGSLVAPGVGTAVGAAVGGLVGGVVVGVSVDKMLLMLEEAISREAFKKEILQAIQEARIEFKSRLKGQGDAQFNYHS